jgi:hypothetical protein
MSPVHIVSLATATVLLVSIVELLRRQVLREKYAVVWLLLAVAVVFLAVWPGLLDHTAHVLHVVDPVNLLLFGAFAVLLLVCLHLSWESSRLEEETRVLAEDLAMLRLQVEQGAPGRDLRT